MFFCLFVLLQIHPSVVQAGGQYKIQPLNLGETLFHCLLCPKFKPTSSWKIQRHMDAHIKNALHVQDNIICRCNQQCRSTSHYHCPYCERTIIRRDDMETHVFGCRNYSSSQLTLALPLLPLSASQTRTTASQEMSRLPCSPTSSALPSSPSVTLAVPKSEPHPTVLDLLEQSIESMASVVDEDHCYTLSLPVSLLPSAASPVSSDIPSASQPDSSSTDALLPKASVVTAAASRDTMKRPLCRVRNLKLVRCPHCSLCLYKKNLGAHIKRKHAGPKRVLLVLQI